MTTNTYNNPLYQPSSAAARDGYTYGRHTLFGTLYLVGSDNNIVPVGGMQSFSLEESNNTQFRAMAGSDWLEPVIGMRSWQGEGQRFQIRTHDFQQIMSEAFSSDGLTDIDFRLIPFMWNYQYAYNKAGGQPLPQGINAAKRGAIENLQWNWKRVIITRYRWSFQGPMELISEDFSFIAKGISRPRLTGNPSSLLS